MLEHEQPAAAPIAQLLALGEIEFVALRSRREALVEKIGGLQGDTNLWQLGPLRDELLIIEERIDALGIETFEHRIALLEAELPANKRAVAPVRAAFEAASQRYLDAFKEQQQAANNLHVAQMKVGHAEASIDDYQRTIEGLRQRIVTRNAPRDFSSEIDDLERRLGDLKAASSVRPGMVS